MASLLPGVLAAVALLHCSCGTSSHSLKYLCTAVSEPSPGLPQFIALASVEDQPFVYYDSGTKKLQPRAPWMEKVGKDDPQYWDSQTQIFRGIEEVFRQNLETLQNLYNQNQGFHTLQWMYGCELRADGSKGGFQQYGYDGRTLIAFGKETLSWVAPDPQAQITRRKWDAIPELLEKECAQWLEKYLSYGKESLLRAEPPVVTEDDGEVTFLCRAHGSDGNLQFMVLETEDGLMGPLNFSSNKSTKWWFWQS